MTLRRKMIYQIGAMIVGLALLTVVPLWGINGLHQDFGGAVGGYQQLRQLYEIGQRIASDKVSLTLHRSDPLWIPDPQDAPPALRPALQEAASALSKSRGRAPTEAESVEQIGALNRVLYQLTSESGQIPKAIAESELAAQLAAEHHRMTTMIAVAGVGVAVILAAILLGVFQYRSVINPLRKLGDSVRQIAAGSFANRVQISGSAEFVALANDFNRMAHELDGLYRELEQKVAAKSKELVRSERLASVGYLAAGVAHEINNPLGIIAGYGERAMELLDRQPNESVNTSLRKSLQIICGEAFRCKEITDRLLSMARGGDEDRRPVDLSEVARHVISIVGALRDYRDSKVTLQSPPTFPLKVLASEAEMKQIVLNLVLNALEAIDGVSGGEVVIALASRDGWVELSISDNGRGMTPQTLERVFEPFYTEKRVDRGDAPAIHGTGLGLSITHAIVAAHGGRIRATSPGLGQGSRLVVDLPASKPDAVRSNS